MIALVSVSNIVIFPPISPSPPRGVTRILWSVEFRYFIGSRRSSWTALFASIALAISCCHCSLPLSLAGKFFFGFFCFFCLASPVWFSALAACLLVFLFSLCALFWVFCLLFLPRFFLPFCLLALVCSPFCACCSPPSKGSKKKLSITLWLAFCSPFCIFWSKSSCLFLFFGRNLRFLLLLPWETTAFSSFLSFIIFL